MIQGNLPSEPIHVGPLTLVFLATGENTGGHFDLFEMTVPEKAKVPAPHFHHEVDETVIGLEGVLTYTVDGQVYEVKPGDRVFAPKGKPHHFTNLHTGPARILSILSPAKIGPAYFRELSEHLRAGAPNPAVVKEIMHKHGLAMQG